MHITALQSILQKSEEDGRGGFKMRVMLSVHWILFQISCPHHTGVYIWGFFCFFLQHIELKIAFTSQIVPSVTENYNQSFAPLAFIMLKNV